MIDGKSGHILRRSTKVMILLMSVFLLASCTGNSEGIRLPFSGQNSADWVTTVDDSGLEFDSDDFKVTAPSGVAPSGTEVEMRKSDAPLTGEWAEFSSSTGIGIEIVIEGNAQPMQPITVEFKSIESAENIFVIIEDENGTELAELVDSPTLTATTTHLSTLKAIFFNVSDFADFAMRRVTDTLGMSSSQPDCYRRDGTYPEYSARITRVQGDAVWPCLKDSASQMNLTIQSNSGIPWLVTTDGDWSEMGPTSTSASTIAMLSVWRTLYGNNSEYSLLMPAEEIEYSTRRINDTQVDLKIDPVMAEVYAVTTALDVFLDHEVLDRINLAECGIDTATAHAVPAPAPVQHYFSSASLAAIAKCIGTLGGRQIGLVISLISSTTSGLWTNIEGALRSNTNTANLSFEVRTGAADINTDIGQEVDPEVFVGKWAGEIDQPGARDYSAVLEIWMEGQELVGSAFYPGLECGGNLEPGEIRGNKLTVVERITEGSGCHPRVTVQLSYQNDTLFYHVNMGSGAIGTLTRVPE